MSRPDWKNGKPKRDRRVGIILKPTMRLRALTDAERQQIRMILKH
jgi:hypothetical protein